MAYRWIPGRHRRMGWSLVFDNSGGSLPPTGAEGGPAAVGTRRGEFGGLFGGVAGSLQRRLTPVPKTLTPALSRGERGKDDSQDHCTIGSSWCRWPSPRPSPAGRGGQMTHSPTGRGGVSV